MPFTNSPRVPGPGYPQGLVHWKSGGATFSPCGTWRYALRRRLEQGDARVLNVIGLNPSTADASRDDPTIRRCLSFARRLGFGSLVVTNAFALRSTDPAALRHAADPVGPGNDAWILRAALAADLVVAAWGGHGVLFDRGDRVAGLLGAAGVSLSCWGRVVSGEPRHPLYLPAGTALGPYPT